jgi:methyl-accepting chemotaxis protein
LPGSHYDLTPQDTIINEKNELYQGYKIDTYLTRFIELSETLEDGTEVPIASLFLEYDRKEIQKRSMDILFSELIILGSVMVVVIMLYMLIAYFTITKNLRKLTVATDSISHELKQANNITPKKLEFRSRDEIASLASSFEVMEEEILNYVNIIKKEAKENERRESELEVASSIQLSALPANSYLDENAE